MSMMEVDKLLFLNQNIFGEIGSGNQFLRDAVVYASSYVKGIFVETETQKLLANEMFGDRIEAQVVNCAEDLMDLLNAILR